jgi:hypothetical protein
VLIHSGSAFSGHYYAYIKDFESCQWSEFNDSVVRRISYDKVVKAFGKAEEAQAKNATNAYMLMYRKVVDAGLKSVAQSSIPSYLNDLIAQQQAEEDQRTAELIDKLSNLTIHVYLKTSYKDIAIRTSETFKELKLRALESFGLAERPSEEFRLRGYLPYTDLMKEVFADDLTLAAVKVYNFMNLALEERPQGGDFVEYDPDQISLKVVVWKDELTPEANIEQPVDAALKVTVSQKATVLELMGVLAAELGCTAEEVVVAKKGYLANEAVVLNPADKWLLTLDNSGMFEGVLLFAEKQTGPSKWQTEFAEAGLRITLFFNDPTAPQHKQDNFEYKYSLSVNSALSLATLKQKLAEKLSLAPEVFIMKVSNKYNSELRPTDQPLSEAHLGTNTVLHLDPDPASVPKAYRIKLFAGVLCYPSVKDCVFERFELLTSVEVLNYLTVATVKQLVCEQIAQHCPEVVVQDDTVQLREMYGNSLGKRLLDRERIESYSLWEDKAYMLLTDPLPLIEHDILVLVKRFYATSWELTAAKYLVVQRATSMQSLGVSIEELFGVPIEKQEVCSTEEMFTFTRLDLPRANWCSPAQQKTSVNHGPLFISRDFTLLIVKDSTEMERELSLEERKLYQPSVAPAPAQWSNTGPNKPKEAAVTIRVKNKVETE